MAGTFKVKIDLWIEDRLLKELDETAISSQVQGEDRIHVRSEIINGTIESFLQRLKTTNYCWKCQTEYDPEMAPQCPECHTRVCPQGHCYCSLTPEAKQAVDMAMKTYGLWTGNPRKHSSGLAEDLYYAFLARGLVKTQQEFHQHYSELYKKYPEILEQVRRERGSK